MKGRIWSLKRVKCAIVFLVIFSCICGKVVVSKVSAAEEDAKNSNVASTEGEFKWALYGKLVERQTNFDLEYTGNDADNIFEKINNDEMIELVGSIDDASTSDDFDYLLYNYESISTEQSGNRFHFTVEWSESKEQIQQVNSKISQILDETGARNMGNAYDIAKTLHDYIVNNVSYDESISRFTAYAALFDKRTVCQGYALLYYKMLTEAGVGCKCVVGTDDTGEAHMWNIVKVGNTWYNVDVTWDDPIGGSLTYDYFLKGSNSFDKQHIKEDKFKSEWFTGNYQISSTDFSKDGYAGGDVNSEPTTSTEDSGQQSSEVTPSDNSQGNEADAPVEQVTVEENNNEQVTDSNNSDENNLGEKISQEVQRGIEQGNTKDAAENINSYVNTYIQNVNGEVTTNVETNGNATVKKDISVSEDGQSISSSVSISVSN